MLDWLTDGTVFHGVVQLFKLRRQPLHSVLVLHLELKLNPVHEAHGPLVLVEEDVSLGDLLFGEHALSICVRLPLLHHDEGLHGVEVVGEGVLGLMGADG